uniref:uncharacterized protein LOC120346962 n=1 Tax=Styela clava TaxID=7725 RepID=UPI00193A9598|nr:uncharacterized protein LOC120346962 [Styela clava]
MYQEQIVSALDPHDKLEETKHAKITQAIVEWFESWQMWQRKILITGIINRFEYNQLRGLLMAVESVFHKDFTTIVQNVYPVPEDEMAEKSKKVKPENTFLVIEKTLSIISNIDKENADGENEETEQDDLLIDLEGSPSLIEHKLHDDNMRMRSPVGHRIRTNSGSESVTGELSHPLSPIAESAQTDPDLRAELPATPSPALGQENTFGLDNTENLSGLVGQQTSILVSHLRHDINSPHASSQATLVSSLSPIEETSLESTVSGGSEKLCQTPNSTGEVCRTETTKSKQKPKGKKSKGKKEKSKEKKIPEEVVKRIASYSVLSNRNVPSNFSLTPMGKQSDVTLDFRSGVTSAMVQPEDFFEFKNNNTLGEPVTTQSKMEAEFELEYDYQRNKLPVPTTQQLYKNKKLWKKDTVPMNVRRLKEQFRTQLDQIWEWIDNWPAYRRTRLLLDLFSKSSDKMIKFTAECLKVKTAEADDAPPPIDMLSDALLLKIFGYLCPYDLMQASFVNRHWHSLLNSDFLWKEKCDEIGIIYGIPYLSDLLYGSAENNQALDWKQAFTEVEHYLSLNLEPVKDSSSESELEEESSSGEEEEERFKDYIPYWKSHPPDEIREKKQQSIKSIEKEVKEKSPPVSKIEPKFAVESEIESQASKKKGGFLQMWKNITEDIKEDLDFDDARSDACYDVDMFADVQEWDDVGLMTNIGQRFAVDYKIMDAMQAVSGNWNIADHVLEVSKVQVFKAHHGGVNVIKAQGSRIFSGSTDRCIRVWDRNGQCFAKMTDSLKGGVNDISIGSVDDCNVMYTASWDMSIRIWNTVTFRLKGTLNGHKGSVTRVAADNKFIVSCSHDGTIKIWDRKKLKCERTIACHKGAVESMIYHNRLIISGGVDKMIHVNNSFTGRLVRSFTGHQGPVTALKKQHDLLLSGDATGIIYFWSMASDSEEHVSMLVAHESQINAICMHGPTFFTASKDALIKEWDLTSMLAVRIFQGHTDAVTDVLWTEKYLLSASKDNDVRIWWWREDSDDTRVEILKEKN